MSSPWLTGCFVSAPPKHRAPRNGLRGSLWWGGMKLPTRAKSPRPVIGWSPTICPRNKIAPHFLGGSWKRRAESQCQRAPLRRLFFIDRQQHSQTAQRSRRARRQAGALPVASLISTPRSPGRPVDEAIRLFPQTTSSTRVRVDLLVPELTTVVSFSRVLAISRSAISSATPALIMPRVTSSASWGSSGQRGRSCSRHRSQYSVCLCRW